jgi:hypothetical protein
VKKLTDINPYLKPGPAREAALYISAKTSSAVEGIRAPFNKKNYFLPANTSEFIAYWRRRVAVKKR